MKKMGNFEDKIHFRKSESELNNLVFLKANNFNELIELLISISWFPHEDELSYKDIERLVCLDNYRQKIKKNNEYILNLDFSWFPDLIKNWKNSEDRKFFTLKEKCIEKIKEQLLAFKIQIKDFENEDLIYVLKSNSQKFRINEEEVADKASFIYRSRKTSVLMEENDEELYQRICSEIKDFFEDYHKKINQFVRLFDYLEKNIHDNNILEEMILKKSEEIEFNKSSVYEMKIYDLFKIRVADMFRKEW